ncbi:MAG: cytochrome c oxidase assembly factor 1 family protein [Chloroflexi bacterium]|nr:cytochrome c oxidase assembly factor 1 family protein [Chloroflexota bacterium]
MRRTVGCLGVGGCISGILVILVVAMIVGGVFYLIMGSFKSSPVYLEAMKAAQANPDVVQALGSPIQSGLLVTGSISEQGISGDASLVIPISGPRGNGTLYASARKGNGVWRFYTLAVQVDGQDQLIALPY